MCITFVCLLFVFIVVFCLNTNSQPPFAEEVARCLISDEYYLTVINCRYPSYTHTHTRARARTRTHARTHACRHAHTCARARTHINTHERTHARTHTCARAYTHTHTHTHTPMKYTLVPSTVRTSTATRRRGIITVITTT